MLIDTQAEPPEPFEGTITLPPMEIRRRSTFAPDLTTSMAFPGFTSEVLVSDGRIVPRNRGILLASGASAWKIVLGAGHAWSEVEDDGWSRASFPFTLVGSPWSSTRNGVATFLYRDGDVSDLYVQIAQEAVFGAKADLWGHGNLIYHPHLLTDRTKFRRAFSKELASRLTTRPWRDLEDGHDATQLARFDGRFNHENISVSALLIDDVIYSRGCRTRHGPYPFCPEMRHAVYSVGKSLGAAVGLLRLAQKYGEEVLDARIIDHVPLTAKHDGWAAVTFRDALNMATGIGNITPVDVDHYVEADDTALAMRIGSTPTTRRKFALISAFDAYPWGPAKVFRYRTSDTFTLAAAMDGFLKSREGLQASLTKMLRDEVFRPLGIHRIPITHSQSLGDDPSIPELGFGMLPTLDEAARLTILLRHHGRAGEHQILHPSVTRDVVDMSRRKGLPTGWTYEDGTKSYYHMGFWRIEFEPRRGCRTFIPTMVGVGGNYILLMPKGLTGFRFADGTDSNPGTWDSSDIRIVADHVRAFCD